jgi:glutamyl endopeptidase
LAVLLFSTISPVLSAGAPPPDTLVYSDGREVRIVPEALSGDLTVEEPYAGPMMSGQEMEDQRMILEEYPDMHALRALKPVTGATGIETIIGEDTRMRIYTTSYPASAVVFVSFKTPQGTGKCTGWMIGKDTVVTAGHCVHGGKSGSWYSGHRVYPGFDHSVAPYGSYDSEWLATNIWWVEHGNTVEGKPYDYGVIKLDSDIGNTTGYFGLLCKPGKGDLLDYPLAVTGYPGDKSLEQWQSHDKVRACSRRLIFYRADSIGGMSGSPMWFDKGSRGAYAIGIHTYGVGGRNKQGKYNHGTRICERVIDHLRYWKNQPK